MTLPAALLAAVLTPAPGDYCLARWLVACDGDAVPPDCPRLFLAVVRVADLDDIARPGEFWGCAGADLGGAVRYAREVRGRLADCPPLADADRWPHPAASWAMWEYARRVRINLESRARWEPDRAIELRAAADYYGWAGRAWDEAWAAASEGQPLWRRREGLKWLKDNLSPGMYAAGELPGVP